jgi:DNA-directed RNA polymerase beta' subunit
VAGGSYVLETASYVAELHSCSPGYTFRKEGHTKIIEYDLSRKQKGQVGKKRPDVLLAEKAGAFLSRPSARTTEDSNVDMSDPEESEMGEDLEQEDEEEESEKESGVPTKAPLPKAANGRTKTSRGRNERVVAPEECRAHLRRLFHNEAVMCSLIYGRHGPLAPLSREGLCYSSADMFFLDVIPITPTRFRPATPMNGTLFEHPHNELLAKVLNTSYRLRDLNIDLRAASQKRPDFDEASRRKLMGALLEQLIHLQNDVNSFMDSSKNTTPMRQGKLPPPGVKQGLEKKEGLFRRNMMVGLHQIW